MRFTLVPQGSWLGSLSLLCAVTAGCSVVAGAQHQPMLSGVVTDSSDFPVFGAVVEVVGTPLKATTDDRGEFRIAGVPAGPIDIHARRLGFAPLTLQMPSLRDWAAQPIRLVLSALPTMVAPVVVEAGAVKFTGRLAGYYERLRRRSGGQFISREEIDRRSNRSLTQLLSATPGISSVRFRGGTSGVRMRGRTCRPLVWLDGVPMPAGEVDLDAFPLSTIHGIELYLGSSSAPFDYTASQGMSSCGTVLLWSRGRDTEPPTRPVPRALDVEHMAASRTVLTAADVDTPAVLLSAGSLEVAYPPSLFAAGVEGAVVAEFVVGVNGAIEPGTFAIVSAAHPLFAEAASRGLERAAFAPAVMNKQTVRQVVHQRLEFSISKKTSKVSAQTGR